MTVFANIDNIFDLSTPAWEPTDLTDVYSGAQQRGTDFTIAFKRGQQPRKRVITSREINIPMYIYGDKNPDGTPTYNKIQGLVKNLDFFKTMVASPSNTEFGTRNLRIVGEGEPRVGRVVINPDLQLKHVGVGIAKIVLNMVLVDGVFESENTHEEIFNDVSDSASNTIFIESSGDILATEIGVEGACDSLQILNDYEHAPGITLNYPYPFTASPTNIDTGNSLDINGRTFEAVANETFVSGKVSSGNTLYWLPMAPGPNNITIIRTGSGTATIKIKYKKVWL